MDVLGWGAVLLWASPTAGVLRRAWLTLKMVDEPSETTVWAVNQVPGQKTGAGGSSIGQGQVEEGIVFSTRCWMGALQMQVTLSRAGPYHIAAGSCSSRIALARRTRNHTPFP